MRILGIIFLLVLLVATYRLRVENQALKHSLEAVSDTLGSQRIQQKLLEQKSFSLFPEPYFQKNKGVQEIHRIRAYTDAGFFLLRFELRQDSSIIAIFKKAILKRPFSGDLRHLEFTQDSTVQVISLVDLTLFKEKINKIEFSDTTIDNDIMCCFGGVDFSWEAILADGNRHYFRTYCRQAVQFAKTCEDMLKLVDDPDLKRILH